MHALLSLQVRHGPNIYTLKGLELFSADGSGGPGRDGSGGGRVQLGANDQGLAAGQYAVLYQDGLCLGAAKIGGQD